MRTICIILLSFFSINSLATTICSGNVDHLGIGPTSGLLQVSNGYGVQYICNFNQPMNGVDQRTCRVWYTMFLAAKTSGKRISMHYDDTVLSQCNQIVNWASNPLPFHVEMID